MATYCVNKNQQNNGDHEVHKEGCNYYPEPQNRIVLGSFFNCREAVQEARKHYFQVNGCYFCSLPCHTS